MRFSQQKPTNCCFATLLPYCANAALPYPMYADGRRLLVFVPFLTVWQRVKKVFDTLTAAAQKDCRRFACVYFQLTRTIKVYS